MSEYGDGWPELRQGRPDPPTIADLERAHDYRRTEIAGGRYIDEVCEQCDHTLRRRANPPCPVREIPESIPTPVIEGARELSEKIEREQASELEQTGQQDHPRETHV